MPPRRRLPAGTHRGRCDAPTMSAPSRRPPSTMLPIMASPILAAVSLNQASEWPCARPVSHRRVGPDAPKTAM